MPRYDIGVHPRLRAMFVGGVIGMGIGFGLVAVLGLFAVFAREPGPLLFVAAFCALGGLIAGSAVSRARRTLRRVAECIPGATRVDLEVVRQSVVAGSSPQRKLTLREPDGGARTFAWNVPDARGVPVVTAESPVRVAALRSESNPSVIVPFTSTGYPFRMPGAVRREILGRPAPRARRATSAVRGRPELPAELPATSAPARNARVMQVFVGVLTVALLITGLVVDDSDVRSALFFLAGTLAFLSIFIAVKATPARRVLLLDERGIGVRTPLGCRKLPWEDVDRIVVRGHDHRAESRAGIWFAVGGLIGATIAAATTSDRAVRDRVDGSGDPIHARLRAAGMGSKGVFPHIEVFDTTDVRVFNGRVTHTWAAAGAVVAEATARGIPVEIG